LSKTYNMTGWRIGMACGNAEILGGLKKVKTNVDSGVFNAIQVAGIAALTGPQECVRSSCEAYEKRRNALVKGLSEIGIECPYPKATFYVWVPVDNGVEFATRLLDEAGVVVTPGVGFGSFGSEYVRFAVTRALPRIEQAIERIRRMK
ncbi:MAG: aminotransferase class I/II-fold pyridoxal phosphate-dependent enzyme, partial [Methanomicrobiales archaeon]|nr:aminotransferase class I/II-fold pyridoxal phosphate-dependent enzyme [Methanomicrobiales archaeon]